uniref:C2H2-type domain-containing protein n=1 Tax=Lutzomyia longipalpis TaxID=7200 RepID=A0A1B0CNQ1_LUTLO
MDYTKMSMDMESVFNLNILDHQTYYTQFPMGVVPQLPPETQRIDSTPLVIPKVEVYEQQPSGEAAQQGTHQANNTPAMLQGAQGSPPPGTSQCPHCFKTFKSAKAFKSHLRTHSDVSRTVPPGQVHGMEPKQWCVCNYCNKVFYDPNLLKQHIATHTKEQQHKCQFCYKSFPEKAPRRSSFPNVEVYEQQPSGEAAQQGTHQANNTPAMLQGAQGSPPPGTSQCPHCFKTFKSAKAFKSHLRTHSDVSRTVPPGQVHGMEPKQWSFFVFTKYNCI